MKNVKIRIVGLASSLLLILITTLSVAVPPARGQNPPINPVQNLQTLAQTTLQQVTSGQITAAQGAQILSAASTPGINGLPASVADFQNMFTALQSNGNVNAQSAIALFGSVASGAVTPQIGQALAAIQGLGNINTPAGLTAAINSVAGLVGLGNAQNPAAVLGSISNIIGLVSGGNAQAILADPAMAAALAQNLLTAFPQIAGIDISTLTGALGNLGALLGGADPTALIGTIIGGLLGINNPLVGALGLGGSICGACCSPCMLIHTHYAAVRSHVTSEFSRHRAWFIATFWYDNILPALMLMAEQLTVTGVHQVEIIGTFLDAKHQLETQRLFQELSARAHKDYQPSEGMCTFGTGVRLLNSSERLANLNQLTIAQRMTQRQTLAGENLATESAQSDIRSRLEKFITSYCDVTDNANGLSRLCGASAPNAARRNIDIDYTRNIESRLTLDFDVTPPGAALTADEEDVFSLSANLFAHNLAPRIMPELMGNGQGLVRLSVMEKYMDLRAIYAKRSVAQNSFAALTAMRTRGHTSGAPFLKAIMLDLGVEPADINVYLGENPSYFAQMEVLTKKIYQGPNFYTELYDKPANVERKGAALQAIGLMQDRDIFNSLIRSEAVLSVLLETMLEKEQEKVTNAYRAMEKAGGAR